MSADIPAVSTYLLGLQDRICSALEATETSDTRFERLVLEGERGGQSRPRVLDGGSVIERAAVHFSHTVGASLPAAATTRRPELSGQGFEAVSVSLIVHPRNPFAPTVHANFRCFSSDGVGGPAVWWFGGGFDMTPYYGFEEDAIHWHRNARAACAPFSDELYPRLKADCDSYFYLPHRAEPRGIGGLFYDDMNEGGFERCFAISQSLGDHFIPGYLPILEQRKDTPYSDAQRDFQLYRRGRYVEFNLAWDRGTRFGLQSGGRIESILASLPPVVHWRYDWTPEAGSEEARLYSDFLRPRDWAGEAGN